MEYFDRCLNCLGQPRRSSPHRRSSLNQPITNKSKLIGIIPIRIAIDEIYSVLIDSVKSLLEQNQSIISTKCHLQFNFISLCVLHQDIQTNNQSLREFADSYFSNTSTINPTGILDEKQINELRLKYSQACLKDHLS